MAPPAFSDSSRGENGMDAAEGYMRCVFYASLAYEGLPPTSQVRAGKNQTRANSMEIGVERIKTHA